MEFLASLWEWYTSGGASGWISAITGILTAATVITAMTPTAVDNTILNGLLKALNLLAGNIFLNRNADAPAAPPPNGI